MASGQPFTPDPPDTLPDPVLCVAGTSESGGALVNCLTVQQY